MTALILEEVPMTLKLNHLHLKTRDPEQTAKFYVDTLGARIVSQSPNGGYRLDLHGLHLNVSNFLESQTREQKYGMEHSLEPISIVGTCATEAMWDAVLGGEPAAICRYCKGSRQQDAPRSPRPCGLRPGRASASLPGLTLST